MRKLTGYIIHEDEVRVAIATLETENRKTGPMLQVWILPKKQDPIRSAATGADRAVCGNCPLRGVKGQARACYVNLGQAPLAVWRKWKRGGYPALPDVSLFAGALIRFGAYGDPAFIPLRILDSLCAVARGWTGYTHQWCTRPELAAYLMASVDSMSEQIDAASKGWRTFRVFRPEQHALFRDEILCPSGKVSCAKCRLCCGTARNARSIAIPAHGTGSIYVG